MKNKVILLSVAAGFGLVACSPNTEDNNYGVSYAPQSHDFGDAEVLVNFSRPFKDYQWLYVDVVGNKEGYRAVFQSNSSPDIITYYKYSEPIGSSIERVTFKFENGEPKSVVPSDVSEELVKKANISEAYQSMVDAMCDQIAQNGNEITRDNFSSRCAEQLFLNPPVPNKG